MATSRNHQLDGWRAIAVLGVMWLHWAVPKWRLTLTPGGYAAEKQIPISNTETGFLVPRPRREEEGKITSEGCYRLWKEMWLLAYLGKSCA
jgi:hypothetical protein